MLFTLFADVRYSLRTLRAAPGFSAVVVAVLAIGIGANTAMFTAVDASFLRPLPFPKPDRLVEVNEQTLSGDFVSVSYPNFLDWEGQQQVFESVGLGAAYGETLLSTGPAERIEVGYVSAGFLRCYPVLPILGRGFTAEDDKAGAAPVAMLTTSFWQSHYGADPGVVGRKLTSDGRIFTIIGVLPPFPWYYRSTAFFAPIALVAEKQFLNMRENHNGPVATARLKPGVTIEQARAQMHTIARRLALQYPGANSNIDANVRPLQEHLAGGMHHSVLLLFGSVTVLLLIACANVAGLLLARSAVRRREMAVRAALGASRGRLIAGLLTESLLLAGAGAVGGIWIATLSLGLLARLFPGAANLGGLAIDLRVLCFSLAVAVVTALVFGLVPAVHLARPDLVEAMKGSGRSHTGSVRLRTRKALVISQVALSTVLLIGAGLLTRSLMHLRDVNPGFRAEHVLTLHVELADRADADAARAPRFFADLVRRVEGLPTVQSVGVINNLPLSGRVAEADFYRDDQPLPEPGRLPGAEQAAVMAGYFRAMGIPVLHGRLLTEADGVIPPMKKDLKSLMSFFQTGEFKVVINEAMARKFWPGEDPIGKKFRFGPPSFHGPAMTIVGIVGNVRQVGLERAPDPQFFMSGHQYPMVDGRLVVRTAGDPVPLASMIRSIVAQMDKYAVVSQASTMENVIASSLSGRTSNVMVLLVFSGIALLLAALGLYGTMAYMVAQRTQEIGVRMALGAASSQIRRAVIREGALLAGAGLMIGVVAAVSLARFVGSMLYGVTTVDVGTYAGAVTVLVVITIAASYVPARRASRIEPMQALRCE